MQSESSENRPTTKREKNARWVLIVSLMFTLVSPARKSILKVSPSHTILEVKEILAMQVSIPVVQQKLVFKGKSLADDKRLSDYNVQNHDKLFLFMKKPDDSTTPSPAVTPVISQSKDSPLFTADKTSCSTTVLWDKLREFLQRHFTKQDTEKVLIEYQKEFFRELRELSLDDIERLAASKLGKYACMEQMT
ncbi:hypothetical protein FSP39_002126 [Pinctada imbricata]|uniref:Ubiquitin-like domain-containing protein n=1 Tax=Pinctada imbricata TaxID=66713 RepID=A0AA88YH25_PINIB|nr:hypothetical protein FSP39_002126 [Pinctada imbricata]